MKMFLPIMSVSVGSGLIWVSVADGNLWKWVAGAVLFLIGSHIIYETSE